MNEELELYALIISNQVNEFGWVNENEFIVWILFSQIGDFIQDLKRIFGNSIFDDGRFTANIQEECICINLCEAIGGHVDVESVFPKDEYRY